MIRLPPLYDNIPLELRPWSISQAFLCLCVWLSASVLSGPFSIIPPGPEEARGPGGSGEPGAPSPPPRWAYPCLFHHQRDDAVLSAWCSAAAATAAAAAATAASNDVSRNAARDAHVGYAHAAATCYAHAAAGYADAGYAHAGYAYAGYAHAGCANGNWSDALGDAQPTVLLPGIQPTPSGPLICSWSIGCYYFIRRQYPGGRHQYLEHGQFSNTCTSPASA